VGQNNIEEIDTLEDTMVFKVEDASSTKELNVIREKNEVVDFTSPVKVLSDIKDKKGSKSSKNQNKSSKPKKEKVKREFKLLSNIKSWWSVQFSRHLLSIDCARPKGRIELKMNKPHSSIWLSLHGRRGLPGNTCKDLNCLPPKTQKFHFMVSIYTKEACI
jgi:hypothetical protein